MTKPERLQKILSLHGVASRREAENMIKQGRVTVNGLKASIGQSAHEDSDSIEIDGVPLKSHDDYIYIMLNKPRGFITTVRDDRGRKTVMQLVKELSVRVYPVGRLDMDSEGLLLMTNDGNFANIVMHPRYNHLKTYDIVVSITNYTNFDINAIDSAEPSSTGIKAVATSLDRTAIKADVASQKLNMVDSNRFVTNSVAAKVAGLLSRPMNINGTVVKAAVVKVTGCTKREIKLKITIHEGRNRQIRKMCALCGLQIKSLRRVSIGELELGDLAPGQWRPLTESERKHLLETDRQ